MSISSKNAAPVAAAPWQKKAAGTTDAGAVLPTPPVVQTEAPNVAAAPEAPAVQTQPDTTAAEQAAAPVTPTQPAVDDHNQTLAAAAEAAKDPVAAVAAAVEGEVMVTATVPKAFQLRIDNHVVIPYKAGVQEMPIAHAEHWYAKANGVQVYSPK